MLYVPSLPPISLSLCVPPWACVYHRGRPANAVCLQGRQIVEVQLEPGEVYHAWYVSPSLFSCARSPRPGQAKQILISIPGSLHLQVPHGDPCPPHSLIPSRAAAQAHDRAHYLLVNLKRLSDLGPGPGSTFTTQVATHTRLPSSHRIVLLFARHSGIAGGAPPPK